MSVSIERAVAAVEAAELLSASLRDLVTLRERVALAESIRPTARACRRTRHPNRYEQKRNDLYRRGRGRGNSRGVTSVT
jgi:hypothetical protein